MEKNHNDLFEEDTMNARFTFVIWEKVGHTIKNNFNDFSY